MPDPSSDPARLFERVMTADPARAASAVSALASVVVDPGTLVAAVSTAAHMVQTTVDGASWVSVGVQVDPDPPTSTCTATQAQQLDEAQYRAGSGPGLDAGREHGVVSATLEQARTRWPAFADVAERLGVRSVVASGLDRAGGPVRGWVTVYSNQLDALDGDSHDFLVVVGELLARAVESYVTDSPEQDLAERLGAAVRRRSTVQQAAGVTAARLAVTPERALELLRDNARRLGSTLEEHADRLLAEREPGRGVGAGDLLSAFDDAPVGMAISDLDGRLLTVNAALAHLLGHPAEDLAGVTLFDATHPDDVAQAVSACEQLRDGAGLTRREELRLVHARSGSFPAIVWASKVLDGAGRPSHLVMHVQDTSAHERLTDDLRRAALHDPLTGLPNRTLLHDRLESALRRHARDRRPVSVLFLDLDGFKAVNDTHGHAAGDAVLTAVAAVLSANVRPGDTTARVGGDEFVVLCEDTDEADAGHLAERLVHALARTSSPVAGAARISASVGAATTNRDHPGSARHLLARADAVMYAAKQARDVPGS